MNALRRVLPPVVLALSVLAGPAGAQPVSAPNPLLGAWEMQAVHWIQGAARNTVSPAQPGLFLFTEQRYSIMWTPTRGPRTPFGQLSNPTDAETISGFRSVVFNAGSYELAANTLTNTAQIAKVPGFEGGRQFFRVMLEGDQLTLTMFDETYPGGVKPDWAGKVQTQFVLKRVR